MYLKIIFLLLFSSFWAESREIRFPTEELATESVLPVFSGNDRVLMNRNVELKHKLNVMGSVDYRADEPFYYRVALSGGMDFFLNEAHGLGALGVYFLGGVSSIGDFFSKPSTQLNGNSFQATEAPHPRYAFFLNYNWVPFYGKLSLFKNVVTNYNISLNLGVGAVALIQDQSPGTLREYGSLVSFAPIMIAGLNQKIFIWKRYYIHGWLRFFLYYGPNPIWCKIEPKTLPIDQTDVNACLKYTRKTKPYSDFDKTFVFRNLVGLGAGVLLF